MKTLIRFTFIIIICLLAFIQLAVPGGLSTWIQSRSESVDRMHELECFKKIHKYYGDYLGQSVSSNRSIDSFRTFLKNRFAAEERGNLDESDSISQILRNIKYDVGSDENESGVEILVRSKRVFAGVPRVQYGILKNGDFVNFESSWPKK